MFLGVDGCTKHVTYLPLNTIYSHSQILLEKNNSKHVAYFDSNIYQKPKFFNLTNISITSEVTMF